MLIIEREIYLNQLINKQNNGLVKIVTGIKKCGKSFLLDPIFKEYLVNIGINESSKLEYLCQLNGIVFVKQEESYTSKSSFWDKDEIPVYNDDNPKEYTFSDKRIHRGMYKCANGKCLNADVNGALNILRKSNVVSLNGLYTRGEVDTPVRIRIA